MEKSKEKSLKIIHESIFDKIKNFIMKIFKKGEALQEQIEEQETMIKETIIPQKTEEEQQEDLIRRIESEEIKTEEQKDEELERIKENLSRYLGKIQKEINKKEHSVHEMQNVSCEKTASNQ